MFRLSDHAVNGMAGGAAGMTVDAVLYPLDTIKTRLQARRPGTVAPPMGNFYRGMLSNMLGSLPAAATFWLVYEDSKARLQVATGGKYLPLTHVGAAIFADMCVMAVRNPFEVVKQQMQVGMHRSLGGAFRDIIKVDGLRGLWAGYASTVKRDAPFDAVQFLVYEELKRRWQEAQGGKPLVLWQNGVAGFVSGGLAAGVTTPLDVVKTRLMTQAGTGQREYSTSVIATMRKIHAAEGGRALFAGVVPRMMWISIGGAVFIGTFEEIRRRLQRAAAE